MEVERGRTKSWAALQLSLQFRSFPIPISIPTMLFYGAVSLVTAKEG